MRKLAIRQRPLTDRLYVPERDHDVTVVSGNIKMPLTKGLDSRDDIYNQSRMADKPTA